MAKVVQMFRQPSSQAASYVGANGQLIVDTDLKTVRVHDGATPGGFASLVANNNLADLSDITVAKTNLNLGTAADHAATDFDLAGAAAALIPSITTAQTTATGAETHAQTAITAAAAAQTTANTAETYAQIGITAAAAAQTTANAAETHAQTGITNAAAALTAANLAETHAQTGITNASTAQTAANAAQTTANAAAVKANNLSDLANAATARTNLGLGTSAVVDTGTSGAKAGLLNGANSYSAKQTFTAGINITGVAQQSTVTLSSISASGLGAGARAVIGDASLAAPAFASIAVGSGLFTVPVYSDGTNWRYG